MKNPNGLLMIEPSGSVSAQPTIDALTRKMTAALRQAGKGATYRGFHACRCGARSSNRETFVGHEKVQTNSLAVHYLAYHRTEVPTAELQKVATLQFGEAEPSEAELSAPRA